MRTNKLSDFFVDRNDYHLATSCGVSYLPYVGGSYAKAPRQIMILDDGYYDLDYEFELGMYDYQDKIIDGSLQKEDKESFSPFFSRHLIDAYIHCNSHSRLYYRGVGLNKFNNITRIFCNEKDINEEIKEKVWRNLCYYQFVQTILTGTEIMPSKQDYDLSEEPFFNVLTTYRPNLILVCGEKLYNRLPKFDRYRWNHRDMIFSNCSKTDATRIFYYEEFSSKMILITSPLSLQFNSERWKKFINDINL